MKNLRVKRIFRFDEIQRHFRLFNINWERGVVGAPGGGYSAKLAFAVERKLFLFQRNVAHVWRLTFLGIRVSYARSHGGIFA